MSFLFESFNIPCVRLERKRQPDGEGGYVSEWSETEHFEASIVLETSVEAEIAQQMGSKAHYRVTLPRGVVMDFHDVFMRIEDKQIFRVTTKSLDTQTPERATFSFSVVKAEEWVLT